MEDPEFEVRHRPRGRSPIPAPSLEALTFNGSEPIERQVYASLRRALISGAIPPGAKVSSRSIASSLGVSTMPVREALKRLESDGALESSMKSAFVVPYPTAAEYGEIIEVRLKLEAMLAAKAAPMISTERIDEVEWLQERMVQSTSWRQVLNYNQQMHFGIYSAAGMPYALSLVENIWVRSGPILHMAYAENTPISTFDSHYDIIEALRARDADKVAEAIRADLISAAKIIVDRLQAEARPDTPGAVD